LIFVGIDVAKDKHDCCILGPTGEVLRESFSFANNRQGFDALWIAIQVAVGSQDDLQIKAGLEATGHYSDNLVAFLRSSGIEPVVFNPLRVKLFRQALSLRKTKTDKVDAKCIASLLMSDDSNPVAQSYQIQELKSLTRHRSRLVSSRSKAKTQLARLVDMLFPELPSVCWAISQKSILSLLKELPGAGKIARSRVDRLIRLLSENSHGKYKQAKAWEIKALAQQSVGRDSEALSFELVQVIESILFYERQISVLDKQLAVLVKAMGTPLLSIPGIGCTLAAIILAEIGDVTRFASPDKLLAFAGLEPSTYQSGHFTASKTPMVKHGSTYLRWALMQAARLVAMRCPDFKRFKEKKLAQGKHHFVVLGHIAKKLVRVIFHILTANESFISQAT
jgi:transposase